MKNRPGFILMGEERTSHLLKDGGRFQRKQIMKATYWTEVGDETTLQFPTGEAVGVYLFFLVVRG